MQAAQPTEGTIARHRRRDLWHWRSGYIGAASSSWPPMFAGAATVIPLCAFTNRRKEVSMRFHRIALLVSAFLLSMAAPAAASTKDASHRVPFRMTGTTMDSYADPNAVPTCPEGAIWRYFGDGTMNVTHLGPVTIHMTHCTFVTEWTTTQPPAPLAGKTQGGVATLTGANSDQLLLSYKAAFHIELRPEGLFSIIEPMTWKITGGTGRFAHATGKGTTHAIGDIQTSTTTGPWTGTIVYHACEADDRVSHLDGHDGDCE
jgi:hypothetical protein